MPHQRIWQFSCNATALTDGQAGRQIGIQTYMVVRLHIKCKHIRLKSCIYCNFSLTTRCCCCSCFSFVLTSSLFLQQLTIAWCAVEPYHLAVHAVHSVFYFHFVSHILSIGMLLLMSLQPIVKTRLTDFMFTFRLSALILPTVPVAIVLNVCELLCFDCRSLFRFSLFYFCSEVDCIVGQKPQGNIVERKAFIVGFKNYKKKKKSI